jgi:hypothetical protein
MFRFIEFGRIYYHHCLPFLFIIKIKPVILYMNTSLMFQVNRKITRQTFTTNSPTKIDTVTNAMTTLLSIRLAGLESKYSK